MKNVSASQISFVLEMAGTLLRPLFEAGNHAIATKADGSPVSQADHEAHGLLMRELPRILDIPVLSEESPQIPASLPRLPLWVIDPIDGTKEFLAGIPEFSASIALWDGSNFVAGGVLNPATGEIGCVGTNGEPIFVSRPPTGNITVSRTEFRKYKEKYSSSLKGKIRPMGSIAYKLLRVAAGTDRATFSLDPKSVWDIAGGLVLLNRSDKRSNSLSGKPLSPGIPLRTTSGIVAGFLSIDEEEAIIACGIEAGGR